MKVFGGHSLKSSCKHADSDVHSAHYYYYAASPTSEMSKCLFTALITDEIMSINE